MIIPKKNRVVIYEALFKDGVMVAKKDCNIKHPELETISNLEVMMAMKSLKSRGFVRENFAWRHFYWYLTNEGITYLREFLHLPPEIVPSTLKKQQKAETSRPRPKGPSEPRSPTGRGDSDRDAYRRGGPMDSKPAPGSGSDFRPEFRGGAGIGRGRMGGNGGGGFGLPSS